MFLFHIFFFLNRNSDSLSILSDEHFGRKTINDNDDDDGDVNYDSFFYVSDEGLLEFAVS